MDGARFDALTRSAVGLSRRRLISQLAGALVAGVAAAGARGAAAQTCRAAGRACSKPSHCCSGICDDPDATGRRRCVCPPETKPCRNECIALDACCANDDCADFADQCNNGVCDHKTGRCRPVPGRIGRACDDGDPCTEHDVCQPDGRCGGTPKVCDDGLACTDNTCQGGDCITTLQAGFCLIAGACVEAGTPALDNPCRVCDPSRSTDAWLPVTDGTACDDGDPCTANDSCQAGVCTGDAYTCTPTGCQATSVCDGQGGCTTTPVVCGPEEVCCNGPCKQADGSPCAANGDCCSGVCIAGTCRTGKSERGGICDDDGDCASFATDCCGPSGSQTCTSTFDDSQNCGWCGNQCPSGKICCQALCEDPEECCDGSFCPIDRGLVCCGGSRCVPPSFCCDDRYCPTDDGYVCCGGDVCVQSGECCGGRPCLIGRGEICCNNVCLEGTICP